MEVPLAACFEIEAKEPEDLGPKDPLAKGDDVRDDGLADEEATEPKLLNSEPSGRSTGSVMTREYS